MKMRVGCVLLLCACALALNGCLIENAGPCYGYGCPSHTSAPGTTPQNAAVAANAPVVAANDKPAPKPQDDKPHGFVAFLKNLLPSHHVNSGPVSTSPQPPASGK